MSTRAAPAALAGGLVLTAILALPAGSPARATSITGKLSRPGYTVIAVAATGKARAVRSDRGRFRITRPARIVTLHLRAPDGTYAGPVVIARRKHGKRAVLGVESGTRLGEVTVKARRGYARVERRPPAARIDARRWARARRGVPIGARNFGHVRSKSTGAGAPGDADLDGVPAPLDIDDDGDLILDDNDRSGPRGASGAARAAQADNEFHAFSRLTLNVADTVNANAAALTGDRIDEMLKGASDLLVSVLPGDSAELDCGDAQTGLPYCRPGGTGRVFLPGVDVADWPRFPDCCDADGDGFGTLTPDANLPPDVPLPGMTLRHGATTAEIGTGDVLIERVTDAGVETAFPSTQQYVFATVPALVWFVDPSGDRTDVPPPAATPSPGALGTHGNGFPVSAAPGDDVVVTLTYWRPQRRPIEGEAGFGVAGAWTDIGGLVYSPALSGSGFRCPPRTLDETDPDLEVPDRPSSLPALAGNQGGLIDTARDEAADADHTFTLTLNLTQCLADAGRSFEVGEEADFELEAITPTFTGVAIQTVSFKRR